MSSVTPDSQASPDEVAHAQHQHVSKVDEQSMNTHQLVAITHGQYIHVSRVKDLRMSSVVPNKVQASRNYWHTESVYWPMVA